MHGGWPPGKRDRLRLQVPDSPPRKGGGGGGEHTGRWAGCGVMTFSPRLWPPPSLCSSHHPMLQPPSGHHVASSSPRWAVTSRRTTLTSQGVLGHTEAQGLQPVVDVRFGHGKLEFCRAQRVMLVTETLRTQRKFVQRHLG